RGAERGAAAVAGRRSRGAAVDERRRAVATAGGERARHHGARAAAAAGARAAAARSGNGESASARAARLVWRQESRAVNSDGDLLRRSMVAAPEAWLDELVADRVMTKVRQEAAERAQEARRGPRLGWSRALRALV